MSGAGVEAVCFQISRCGEESDLEVCERIDLPSFYATRTMAAMHRKAQGLGRINQAFHLEYL